MFTCELISLQLEEPYLDAEMALEPPFFAVEKTVCIVDGLVFPNFCTEVDFAILVAEFGADVSWKQLIYTTVGLGRYSVTAIEDINTEAAAERDSICRDAARAAAMFRKSLAPRAPKAKAANPRKTARPRVVGVSAPTQNVVNLIDGDGESLRSGALSDHELIDGVDEWDAAEAAADQRVRAGLTVSVTSGSSSRPRAGSWSDPPPPPPQAALTASDQLPHPMVKTCTPKSNNQS